MSEQLNALKLALAALFSYEDDYVDDGTGGITSSFCYDKDAVNKAIAACRQALATPVQEPDGYVSSFESNSPLMLGLSEWERKRLIPVYKSPPAAQRQWVGLTDEEMYFAIRPLYRTDALANAAISLSKDEYLAIETKLKEKNT